MESIDALSKKLSEYLTGSQVEQVNSAYEFANNAHSGNLEKVEILMYLILLPWPTSYLILD